MRMKIVTLFLLAGMVGVGSASEIEAVLSPDSTSVAFALDATLHTVHGSATVKSGEFLFDLQTGAASGEVVVMAATTGTGNEKRDRRMHDKVLQSNDHPRISIRAEKIEGTLAPEGRSEITLIGAMDLLGTPHRIRVPMTVEITGDVATVDAAFSVPYVEWGLEDPSTFVLRVGKEVSVEVRAENVAVTRTDGP